MFSETQAQAAALTGPAATTLQSHHWSLQEVERDGGVRVLPRPVELRFWDDGALSVKRLCNQMRAGYQVEGQQLQVQRVVSTMMACSDNDLMALERQVAQQLPKVQGWSIDASQSVPVLTLVLEGGKQWQLQGKPTYETLYGDSETVFVEVAAQAAPCQPPLPAQASCLQVRQLQYDPQGLQQGAGPWQQYAGSIEGYQHQPNVRNILRIKRFANPEAPAGQQQVDVLDLVVQSEIMR